MISKKFTQTLIIPAILWSYATPCILANQTLPVWKNLPQKKNLDNGLRLIYQKDKSSAISVLYILIRGGKKAELDGKRGLSYLTTRLAVEIPDKGKIQALMNQASQVTMGTKGDYSLIKIACLSESLEETLKIIAKIMANPLFSGLRLRAIKEQMLNRKKTEEDDPLYMVYNAYLETLLADKGYGGSVFGNEESLKKIKKKDIVNFYKNNFRGGNMIVAASSDLEEETFFKICTPYLEKFPSGTWPQPKPEPLPKKKEKKIFIEKETKQSAVSLGFPLPKLTARNFVLAFMLENLLGKGPGSKLWPLRSTQKLAYNVNCRTTQMKEGGLLEAYLETNHAQKEAAIKALKKVLNKLFEEGITEEELEVTKIQSRASFLRNNETKETRTLNLASFELLGLGCEFLNNFFSETNDITIEEMNTYIKDVLNPAKAVEVIVGPEDESR